MFLDSFPCIDISFPRFAWIDSCEKEYLNNLPVMLGHDCHPLLVKWVPPTNVPFHLFVFVVRKFFLPFSEFLSFDLGLEV